MSRNEVSDAREAVGDGRPRRERSLSSPFLLSLSLLQNADAKAGTRAAVSGHEVNVKMEVGC